MHLPFCTRVSVNLRVLGGSQRRREKRFISLVISVLTEGRSSQSMNLRRKFLLQRIDIPSFDYNRTEIKPYINTFWRRTFFLKF